LQMPWYPCIGMTDMLSGTRDPADRRFEDLYQRYVGPLYYSVDIGGTETPGGPGVGGLHVIVLDSQEKSPDGASISEAQLTWLRGDLNRTFDLGRAQGVVLLMHRPLWQLRGNWQRVHDQLVEFNRRPIVIIEGQTPATRGPRVLGVFAASRQAYDQEPAHDGIGYCVVGSTAAAPRGGQTGEAFRHFTLLKFDANGELHPALVRLGGGDEQMPQILGPDVVTAAERKTLESIADLPSAALGVDGVIDDAGNPVGAPLRFHLDNPLDEAFDLQLRMAAGCGWEFTGTPFQKHITATGVSGAHAVAELALKRSRPDADIPVVEAVLRWPDGRGRVHEVVLPRAVAISPALELAVAEKAIPLDATDWAGASGGRALAWGHEPDRPRKVDPTIVLRADADRVLVQVHVSDATASFWPALQLDPAWGGIASDAVSVAWAKGDKKVQRVWVLPFAPAIAAATRSAAGGTPEIWMNNGLGDKQSPLQRADAKLGIQALVKLETGGYTVTLALPRKLVCDEIPAVEMGPAIPLLTPPPPTTRIAATAFLNVAVYDNDETARTWVKSWTQEDAGPDAWARLQLIQPTPPQAGIHLP